MSDFSSTLKDSSDLHSDPYSAAQRRPGLVLLFSGGKPATQVISLGEGSIELGRGSFGMEPDQRMSRRHARVSFDGHRFVVTDIGSQNGTACDGKTILPNEPTEATRVIRMGDSLFGVMRDVQPLVDQGVKREGGRVMGPALQSVLMEARQAAEFGNALHITGESGTGKEFVAQTFHEHGPMHEGRFVPVNCAAIPQGLAERLLFGTRRGAYSGADADAEGYIQAAVGGTLFLDEVGDLDLNVQAKLLRVLETKEILPLGASRPRTIDLKICSATNKDLKTQVGAGRFREDLYYRIGRPVVWIPPLRKRMEEIPWLLEGAMQRVTAGAALHLSFVETCVLRPWPGNIRELHVEARSAAQTAARQRSARVEARHLAPGAGTALRRTAEPIAAEPTDPTPPPMPIRPLDPAERARLEEALQTHQGNVSGAARAMGMHRTQLRRLIERYGIDPTRFSGDHQQRLDSDDL